MVKDKLSISAKALMACELINGIIDLFLNTFLVAYLLNITNENIGSVAIYYIIDYLITGIFIYVLSFLLKRYNISNIYRIGIIFKCIFVIIIVFLKQEIQNYLILIAFILGIAETTYWGPCDNLVGYVTNNENRKKYTSNRQILRTIIKIVMPVLLGTSIELFSFYKVSTYVLILAIIQVILSLFIKIENKNDQKFDLKGFFGSLKNNKKIDRVKNIYKTSIIHGVLLNVIPTLITIIIMMTFKTNFQLGLLNTVFAVFSMLIVFLFKKFYNTKNSKIVLLAGGLISLASVISLILNIGKTELIIYNFISNSFIVILDIIFNIERFNNIENGIEEQYIIENQTFIIMIMQIGRILGYGLLFIASMMNNIIYFKITLLFATICIPIYSLYMYRLKKT